jgi:hypothetical protein
MDRLTDFLPLPVLLKTEQMTEDRKQKAKNPYKKHLPHLTEGTDNNQSIIGVTSLNWDHIERRSGNDRRYLEKERGKWLDSRAEKDRRQLAKAVFVKI